MLRSLYASISGLRAHQAMMDVTANNIANVNTQGFKAGRAVFADALSQTVRGGGIPTDASGSTNPMQIGLGSRVAAVSTSFDQGALELTGRTTDLAIQGTGFFVVERAGSQLMTRDGSFNWDSSGQLVTAGGARVLGWTADASGEVNSTTAPSYIAVPTGVLPPAATTSIVLGGNVAAGTATGDYVATSGTVHDSLGTAFDLNMKLTKTGVGTWTASISATDPNGVVKDVTPSPAPTLSFDATGNLTTTPANITLTNVTLGTGAPQTISMSLGNAQHAFTQFDQVSSMDMPVKDGSAGAELASVSFGTDGSCTAQYTNGDSKLIAKVAIANVTNPEGMLKAGDNMFATTLTSGDPTYGTAGTGEFGTVAPGALEGSNVDLAQEFTNLVLAQRGFQANTRVITTSDEMLSDLVNVKR
ncbi:MAG: flagellar hook protein FlgE [Ilumatobacteraceae bacterium]|nr:flagellar hook protein FlgE [Ilumatobacteraceae bacterium]